MWRCCAERRSRGGNLRDGLVGGSVEFRQVWSEADCAACDDGG